MKNQTNQQYDKIVPDTSIIIEGILSSKIEKKELVVSEIIIPDSMVLYFENQTNENKASGYLGIDEFQKLKKLHVTFGFELRFLSQKLILRDLKFLTVENLDTISRDLAFDEDATFITSSHMQVKIAQAKGIKFMLVTIATKIKKLILESYFDDKTMSIHLRENLNPHAKKGRPGEWQYMAIGTEPLTAETIQEISRELIEEAKIRKDGFIEIERPGSTIIQLGNLRIVITKPPFSDGWEITAVRPVAKLTIDDYQISDLLKERIIEKAEGILIAGAPGMGKSTFATALAEFYASKQKVVKTVEAPRDLMLTDNITQYAISHGDSQEIHDILLLSRPDFTFFDEMRNTDDFRLFADLRLAGIGFIGIVHATKPIDAIQRFVGRIELGVIPQVIDTVIFIKNGIIDKVLNLQMLVKVPSGMIEADLARPIVVVSDFETKKPEYELYSYGEETVVIPVKEERKTGVLALAQKQLESEFRKISNDICVEMVSDNKCIAYVPEDQIPKLIGKGGKNISEIEKQLGVGIDVKSLSENLSSLKDGLRFDAKILNKSIVFNLDPNFANREVQVLINNDYLLSAKISKKGVIKIKKNNKIGKIIIDALNIGEEILIVE